MRAKSGQSTSSAKTSPKKRRVRDKDDLKFRWSNFQSQARRRCIPVSISLLEYFHLILQPCVYCGGRHRSSVLNGVDRVNSDGNYSIENSVPCCKTCNYMKGPMKKREFIAQVHAIYEYAKQQATGALEAAV